MLTIYSQNQYYNCLSFPSPAARSYNPALSLWLSVDPLSDKYPNTSPYMYCAGNPVVLKDPDGRDIYEFDELGNIRNVASSEQDIFYKVDQNGTRMENPLVFDRKVVSDNIIIDGNNKSSYYLKIDNANDADDIFSFLSESVENSGAEFSNSLVNDNYGNTFSLIGSDIDAEIGKSYSILNLLKNDEYYALDCTHNHYANKQSPSRDDLYYSTHYPNTNFYIRTTGNYCFQYDKNTPADYDIERISIPLKGVSIKPR